MSRRTKVGLMTKTEQRMVEQLKADRDHARRWAEHFQIVNKEGGAEVPLPFHASDGWQCFRFPLGIEQKKYVLNFEGEEHTYSPVEAGQ